jgi:hypothetical protein
VISRRAFLSALFAAPAAAATVVRQQPGPVAPPAGPKPLALPDRLFSPAEGVKLAAADAAGLRAAADVAAEKLKSDGHADDAKDILSQVYSYRYLYLGNIHPAERPDYIRLIDFTLNSLSLRKTMVFCTPLPGAENAVVRVKLDEYQIDPKAWDELGQKGSGSIRSVKKVDDPEPWFHVSQKRVRPVTRTVKKRVQKLQDGRPLYYLKNDGSGEVDRNAPVMEEKEVEEKYAGAEANELLHAPWLPAADITALATALATDFPIFRADWFMVYALQAPAYYIFFGVKNLADLQKLARFSQRDNDLATRGVVSDSSEVAIHQRATQFTPTPLGWWLETFDYLTSVQEDDLLEDLLSQRRDAGELIFNLPNGLQGYGLVNDSAKNDLIDFADPNVASDTRTPLRSKLVWTAVSCITCHDAGVKDVVDEVRLLANDKVALLVKKKADFRSVVDKFSTPLAGPDSPIARGQAMYARAVAAVTRGWTPKKLAQAVSDMLVRYLQEPVDLQVAALDTGFKPDQIMDLIGRLRGPNHTLTQLWMKRPVRRDQWQEKGMPQLMIALYPAGAPVARKK